MNYQKIYNDLYRHGYHEGGLNIGLSMVNYIHNYYDFKSILDIGCSQGNAVQRYQEIGHDAWGIDVSSIAIEKAKENNIKNCYCFSAKDIPFDSEKFDAVVSSDVLEHLKLKDLLSAINEIVRLTKKWIFIRISKGIEGDKSYQKITEKYGLENLHLSLYNYAEWREMFERHEKVHFIKQEGKLLIFRKK